ncbi:MAG: Rid family hydrolase [Sphingomonadaceae bacterium]
MKSLIFILTAAVLSLLATSSQAQTPVKRFGAAQSMIAGGVWAGDTLYLSGALAASTPAADGSKKIQGDTRSQTLSILHQFEATLKEQGLGMGDVVQMRVYLVADGGKLDFAGMNDAYKQFFGTAGQPNKPVRATVQVAALVVPEALVEIEVVAVRSK